MPGLRRARRLRRHRPFRAVLLVLLGVVALAFAALFALTRTDAGRTELVRLVERLASSEGAVLRIGRLDGAVPFDMTLHDVSLADGQGVWLALDRARLAWHPLALLSGRLHVGTIEAGHLQVARAPVVSAQEPAAPSAPPRLPLGIVIDRLAIADIDLGEPLLGVPARLSLAGSAELVDPREGLSATVDLRRIDGTEGKVQARLRYAPETSFLDIEATASEPAGGLVSRLADLPDLPPLSLTIVGAGPLDAWRGDLALDLGDKANARGLVDLRRQGAGRALTARLQADLAAALPARLAPLLEGRSTLAVEGLLGDDGRLTISKAEAEIAAGTLAGAGTIDTRSGAVSGQARLTAGEASRLAPLLPVPVQWAALSLDLATGGTATAPTLKATLAGRDLSVDGERLQELAATLDAQGDGPLTAAATRFSVTLNGKAGGIAAADAALAQALGREASVAARGRVDRKGHATIEEARLDLTALAARFTGEAEPQGIKGKLTIDRADLAALRAFSGQPFAGRARLAADIDAAFDMSRLSAAVDGQVEGLRTGMAQVDGLVGPTATIKGGVRREQDGSFGFQNLTVDAANARLVADGSATAQRANVAAKLALPDLGKLDPRLGGRGDVTATLTGSLARLDARVRAALVDARAMGRPVERLTLDIEAQNVLAAPSGTLALSGSVNGKPATGAGRFAHDAAGAMRVDGLKLALGSVTLTGDAAADAANRITGKAALVAGDLRDIAPLLLSEVAGRVDLQATFDVANGRQRARVQGTAERLAGFGASLRSARIDATGLDLYGRATLDGRVDLMEAASGDVVVSRATVTAKGDAGGTDVTVDAVAMGIDIDARARVALVGDGMDLTLREARIARGGQRIDLAREARVSVRDGGARIAGLELRSGGGRLTVDGAAGRTLDLRATFNALPLALADLASPGLGLTGSLSGDLTLSGDAARPNGRYRLDIAGLSSQQIRNAGLQAFGVNANGTLAGGRTTLDATIRGGSNVNVRVRGSAPLGMQGALDLGIDGRIDLAILNDMLLDGQRIAGAATLDLALRGTPAAPLAQGSVRLANGRFEDIVNGFFLDRIEGTITGNDRALTIASLTARSRNGGTVNGTGRIELDPAAGFPGTITLRADNAQLVASEITNATASLDLSITGPLAREPRVVGRIDVANLDINVPDRLPFSATPIAVRHINTPPRIAARLAAEKKRAAKREQRGGPFVATLDIKVNAPTRVFVRGQGMNSELGGTLTVTGTTAAPVISGGFDMRRGSITVLGRRLTFTRGNVAFPGGGVDPDLDFVAEAPSGDVIARVSVSDRASSPRLSFSSSPDLPQDEVLARLLFGRPSGNLTAGQTIQLAQAVAQLTGIGGVRALDDLSRSLGVDAIDIGAGENGSGLAVGIGKRINDNIYVGVKQGATPGSSGVTVDIDVTRNIKVQGEVDAAGKTSVGVGMEWDY